MNELISKRFSPYVFSTRLVPKEVLHKLFEAAARAASSYNEQPWRFIYACKDTEPEAYDKILDCLVEANQEWAKRAPVLMFSICSLNFSKNEKENRHAVYDTGMAVQNLALEAADRDLYIHQMAGFSADKAREHFGIGENYDVIAAIALGFHEESPDKNNINKNLIERDSKESSRNEVQSFAFEGEWNG